MMTEEFVLIARMLLGAYLLFTGLVKIPDARNFVKLVALYGGLARRFSFLGYVVIVAEVTLGLSLVVGWYLREVAVLTLVMLLIYTVNTAKSLIQKKKMENCGCYGTAIKVPLSWFTLVEDGICLLLVFVIILSKFHIL